MSLKLRFIPIIAFFMLFSHLSQGQLAIESVVIKNVSCFGGDDGEITITVTGAEVPIRYDWIKLSGDILVDGITSNQTTVTFPNIFPIKAGTYFLKVRDNTNSEVSEIRFVTEPSLLQVAISPNPATSCSGSPIQLNGNPAGGTAGYTHQWTGPGAAFLNADNIENPVFNSNVVGDFDITYTSIDANLCVASQTITISNLSNPDADAGPDENTCSLEYILNAVDSFGTGLWSVSGPGNVSFSDETSSTATVTVDAPGTYTFTWTETNGSCSSSDNVLITFFETPDFTTVLSNPTSFGGADGSIQINMTAGSPDYTYKLTDGSSNETVFGPTSNNSHTFSNLSQDSYLVEVIDGNGCVVSQNRILTDTPILSVNLSSIQTCSGLTNGSIDIEILAGANPFDIVVSTIPGGINVYTVSGSNDFNYLIENLASGNYNVYIEDSFGNIEDTDIVVDEGPFATISYPGSPYCDDGVAAVTLVGSGGGIFSASPAGLIINPVTGALDLTNSNNGTYTVSYEYGSGSCIDIATAEVILGNLSIVTISYDAEPYCQQTGGTAQVTINGQVSNSTSETYTAGNLPTDFRFWTVSDDSNCPGFLSVNIPVGSVITAVDVAYSITALDKAFKSDQISQLRAVNPGGIGEESVFQGSGNETGTQQYNRTDLNIANNIIGGGNIQFELHTGRTFTSTTDSCSTIDNRVNNNSWTVTVYYTSGHVFTASDPGLIIDMVTGEIDLENSLPGTYDVYYDYTEGACSGQATTTVTILEKPVTPIFSNDSVCFNAMEQTLVATPPDGGSVIWYTSETGNVLTSAPAGINPGTYTAWASSLLNGCESDRVEATLTIIENPDPPIANNVNTCFDGTEYTAMATVNAGINILWYTDEFGGSLTSAPTGTNPGVYNAWAAAELNGCESDRTEVTLTIFENPDPPIANNVNVCFDGTEYIAMATVNAGVNILWYSDEFGGSLTTAPTGTNPGVYSSWAAAELNGCESSRVEVTLTINDTPDAPTANNVEVCFDGNEYSATAIPPAGASVIYYTSQIGTTTAVAPKGTNPGFYNAWAASLDDITGCESERTEVTLIIFPLPEGTITYGNTNFCPVGTITPIITNNVPIVLAAFSVTPDDGTLDLDEISGEINLATSSPGNYTLEYLFTDENGCLNTATTNITINSTPDAPVANNAIVCFDGTEYSASATPPAGASILWYTTGFGDVTTSAPTGTATGTYSAWAASVDNTTGCESARVEVILTINPLPDAPMANNVTVCYDGTEYSASATAPAGSSIIYYTTEFGNVATGAPAAIAAGVYTAWAASVDDLSMCESERTLVTLTINELPAAPLSNNVIACFDGTVFTATATSPASTTVVYYTTEFGDVVTSAPSASAAGTYTAWAASIDDISGCESPRVQVTLVINDLPAAPTATNVTECFTGDIFTAGATAPAGFSIAWYDAPIGGLPTTAPSASAPGTYNAWAVTVDDLTGCESNRIEVTLIIHPLPEGTISYGATNFCTTGTIFPILTNNVPIVFSAFSDDPENGLSLNPATGEINLSTSTPGTYEVIYRFIDENGCFNKATTTVVVNNEPVISVVSFTNAVCADETEGTGSITIVATSGTPPFTYELLDSDLNVIDFISTDSDFEQTFTDLLTGFYYVIATDDSGCGSALSDAIFIDEPDPITIDPVSFVVENISCNGLTDGRISLTASGGSGQLNYDLYLEGAQIMGPETGIADFTGLAAGTYNVIISDEAGCFVTSEDIIIIEPASVIVIANVGDDLVCPDDEATIQVTISEGTAPYTAELWFDGALIDGPLNAIEDEMVFFSSLTNSGTYTVMVTDANGCDATIDVQVSEPTEIQVFNVFALGDESYCQDGEGIEIILSGSETDVSYQLLYEGNPTGDLLAGTSESISFGLVTEAGEYEVIAINNITGCELTMAGVVTISILPLPQAFEVTGGGIICEGEPGVAILINGSEPDVSYSLLLNGSDTGVMVAGDGGPLDFGVQNVEGTYTVSAVNTVTNCISDMSGSAAIVVNPLPDPVITASAEDICAGVPVTLSAAGGDSYVWSSNPAYDFEGNGTSESIEVILYESTIFYLEAFNDCGIESTEITITINEILADAGNDQTICEGETIVLGPENVDDELVYSWTSSDPGLQFEFDLPNPEVTPFETTTFNLTVENTTLGCVGMASVLITVRPKPLADAGIDQDICIGEEVLLGGEISGPIPANTYLWTSEPEDPTLLNPTISNPAVSPQITTTYTLTETYVLTGCVNQNTITVSVHDLPQTNVIADREVCADEEINLGTAFEETDFSYSWTSDPSGFFSNEANPNLIPGLYPLNDQEQITFTLFVSNGYCNSEASVTITVKPGPVAEIADDMTFCGADEAQNTSIGGPLVDGYAYSWSSDPAGFISEDPNPQVSPTQTTTYFLTVTDTQSGCISTSELKIVINDLTIVSIGNPEICETDSIVILGEDLSVEGGVAPYQYFWSDVDGNSISSDAEPVIEAPFSSSYQLMVMDQLGCFINASVTIGFIESPEVELFIDNMSAGDNYAIYPGKTVTFEALPAIYSFYEFYIIDPVEDVLAEAQNDDILKSLFAGGNLVQSGEFNTYTTSELENGQKVYVVVYDMGCPGYSQTVNISLNNLPNAFTPDNDGFNDIFGAGAELTIFNRWGQKIYRGTEGWNGTFNGAKVAPGTYYYLMNVYDQENKRNTVKGSVTVVLKQ